MNINDKTLVDNVQKNINLIAYMMSSISKESINENTISHLRNSIMIIENTLSLLGKPSQHIEEVKQLKKQISDLENNNNVDISPFNISLYINSISNKIRESLEDAGISLSLNLSISTNMRLFIDIFSLSENPITMFCDNDDEIKKVKEENENSLIKFNQNFDTVKLRNDFFMLCSEKNISKIIEIAEKTLNMKVSSFNFKSGTMLNKDKGFQRLLNLELDFLLMPSDINLSNKLKKM